MGGPTPSITYAVDGPNAAPVQGDVLYYDGTKWAKLAAGTSGQALLTGGAGANPAWGSAGVTDHGALTGLADDDHAGYVRLTPGASARNVIQPSGNFVPVAIKGHATQAVGLLTFQNSADAYLAYLNYDGRLLLSGGSTSAAGLGWVAAGGHGLYYSGSGTGVTAGNTGVAHFGTGGNLMSAYSSSTIPLTVKGAASQSANLQEWQNSAGTVLSKVDSAGGFYAPNTTGYGFIGLPGALTYAGGSLTITNTFSISIGTGSAQPIALHSTKITQNQDEIRLIIRGMSTQANDLIQFQKSDLTVYSEVDALGRFLAPLGSTANCGLAFHGDPNTGLYSTGADVMSLVSGGTDRMKINATGIGFFAVTPVAKATALTAADAGALNTGDAGSDTVIANMRTRLGELETKLQAYGLLT